MMRAKKHKAKHPTQAMDEQLNQSNDSQPTGEPVEQLTSKKAHWIRHPRDLSRKQLIVYVLVFAAIGSFLVFRSFAATSPPGQANQVTLEGTLQVKTGEQFKVDPKTKLPDPKTVVEINEYTLKTADGRSYKLKYPDDSKKHVVNNGPRLLGGSKVRITGKPSAQDPSTIQLAAYDGTGGSTTTLSSVAAAAVNGSLKVAVVLENYTTDTRQPYTVDQARQMVFTDPNSTNAFIQENSFGKVSLTGIQRSDGDVFGYYTHDCSDPSTSASSQLAAQGVDINAYDHVLWYVVGGGCNHDIAGFAELPGKNLYASDLSTSLISHELGHNLGLYHSNAIMCQDNYDLFSSVTNYNSNTYGSCQQGLPLVEYANPYDVMGATNAPGHYEAYDKNALGWLNSASTVTTSGTYTIAPLESPSAGIQMIRVQMGTNKSPQYRYLEFRQPVGQFDSKYKASDLNGVFVSSNYGNSPLLIDPVTYTPGAVVGPGKTFKEPDLGFSFTVTSVTPSGATVSVNLGKSTTAATTVNLAAAAVRGGGGGKPSSGTTGDNASCVLINAPKTAASGSTFLVTITMKNTGTTTWTPDSYDLGRLAYYDNGYGDTIGWFSSDARGSILPLRLSLPGNVAPGAVVSVSATLTAAQGSLNWRMMKESTNTWFGNPCYASTNITSGTDTTPPSAPSNLAIASLSNSPYNSVYMKWTASTDDSSNQCGGVCGYKIYRKGPHDTAFVPWNFEQYFAEYEDAVTSGATYNYYVTAVDPSNNESAPSNTITYIAP
ncbi:hypothetical protein KW801_03035 [Candidatus Saccharibacteria bacterium]|nr:hypothetical protein [Candidatus Saccharibacteria bacterium]